MLGGLNPDGLTPFGSPVAPAPVVPRLAVLRPALLRLVVFRLAALTPVVLRAFVPIVLNPPTGTRPGAGLANSPAPRLMADARVMPWLMLKALVNAALFNAGVPNTV